MPTLSQCLESVAIQSPKRIHNLTMFPLFCPSVPDTKYLTLAEAVGSGQADVWSDISAKSARMKIRSQTSALSDVFEAHADSVDDYVRQLRPVLRQTGAIFAIDGSIEGLEWFDSFRTFRKMMSKLVRSYALGAMETAKKVSSMPTIEDAYALLESIKGAECQYYPAVGLRQEISGGKSRLCGG